MCLMNFMIIRAQIELINRLAYASFSFKNGNVSVYSKKGSIVKLNPIEK